MTVSATNPGATRIELARDTRTALALPGLLVVLGLVLVALGVGAFAFLDSAAPLTVLVALGVLVAALGLWILIRIRSLRLAVEPDYLHLTGIRVDRRYHLAPGSLARVGSAVVTRQRRASSLGGAVGAATLATTGEDIELIRLGATPSVILVPTEQGRVALAAAAEDELVQALMAAARTRAERAPLADTVVSAPAAVSPPATASPPAAVSAPAAVPIPAVAAPMTPPAEPPPPARPLTGIERMALEERLAQERRAAMTGARSEQAAASFATAAALSPPAPAASFPAPLAPPLAPPIAPPIAPPVAVPESPPADVAPPAAPAAAAPAAALATIAATEAVALPTEAPRRFPRALPRRRPLRPTAAPLGRPILTVDIGLLVAPLVGAGVVWLLAAVTGAAPGADGFDPLGAVLLLCGPIALLAVFLARSRWPRLAGLTSVSALIALALVARALIG